MTVTIELPPDIEAGLRAQAQAEGLPVSEYLQNLVRGQIARQQAVSPVSQTACELHPEELHPEEWLRQFREWTQSHAARNLPVLSDEAIGREAIYSDRGL
jgi:hypothetical protein